MVLNLQNAKAAFELYKHDITDVSVAEFAEWSDFVCDFFYKNIVNTEPERFITTQSFSSITSGSQALPTLSRFNVVGTGFYYTDTNGDATEKRLPVTEYGSRRKGYYLVGNTVVFTGVNTPETYVLRYILKRTRFGTAPNLDTAYFTIDTTTSTHEIFREEDGNLLNKALDVLYNEWDENLGAEQSARTRFSELLNDLLEDYRRGPRVYSIPNISSAF